MTKQEIEAKAKAILPALKALIFNEDAAQEPEKVKAAEVTLIDGTVVNVLPALEVGATATIIDSEGNEIAAPDGSHELQDGTVIQVAGGVITEIEMIEAAPEADAKTPPAPPQFSKTDVEAMIAPLKAELAANKTALKQMYEVVEALAAQPAAPATEPKHNPFAKKNDPEIASKLALALSKLNHNN